MAASHSICLPSTYTESVVKIRKLLLLFQWVSTVPGPVQWPTNERIGPVTGHDNCNRGGFGKYWNLIVLCGFTRVTLPRSRCLLLLHGPRQFTGELILLSLCPCRQAGRTTVKNYIAGTWRFSGGRTHKYCLSPTRRRPTHDSMRTQPTTATWGRLPAS